MKSVADGPAVRAEVLRSAVQRLLTYRLCLAGLDQCHSKGGPALKPPRADPQSFRQARDSNRLVDASDLDLRNKRLFDLGLLGKVCLCHPAQAAGKPQPLAHGVEWSGHAPIQSHLHMPCGVIQ